MTNAQTNDPTVPRPLRLWPGVVAVALQWLVFLVVPMLMPDAGGTAILGGAAGGLLVLIWWLFFSRAPWSDRVGAVVVMVGAVVATKRVVHASIANAMMGMMLPFFAIPVLSLALVASAAATRRLSQGLRRASMAAAILLACGAMTLLRTGGITGDAVSEFHWRWTQSPEERLLAQAAREPALPAPAPAAAATPDKPLPGQASAEPRAPLPPATVKIPDTRVPAPAPAGGRPIAHAADTAAAASDAEWPGFRGPARDGVVRGSRIETDWSRKPPVALWRRPAGPAWSSFAVHGNLLYTQEQRGDDEVVSSYNLATGEPVWMHRDAVRFWESNAGAGPRATPTLSHGRVYTLGATGVLNALEAGDGSVAWSRNAVTDTGATVPHWGIAGSPLVVGDIVVAAAAGSLAGYDALSGNPRWVGPKGGGGYGSPHLVTIDGVAQILLLTGDGAVGVAPSDGSVLWKHAWSGDGIVQPAMMAGGDLLIGSGSGMGGNSGMLRFTVAHEPDGWKVKERWTSAGLKPYFNDFVVHAGHAFGFDGSILACIDLADGKRKWKGGRYGHGQLVLLPDQDLLLVLSEEGELALVKAAPDQFTELARFPAIEGKTWNHPVLVGDILLVRNGEEMAAFRLSVAGS